jgi:hypothetical protein
MGSKSHFVRIAATAKRVCIQRLGRVAEWFKAAVLKTARGFTLPRGFESHPFRQIHASARHVIRSLPHPLRSVASRGAR